MPARTSSFVPAWGRGSRRRSRSFGARRNARGDTCALGPGTTAAELLAMATHIKRPSEAWTVPLHVVMWTTITVGFIMGLVVLMMH
jgi:hypothetical protein